MIYTLLPAMAFTRSDANTKQNRRTVPLTGCFDTTLGSEARVGDEPHWVTHYSRPGRSRTVTQAQIANRKHTGKTNFNLGAKHGHPSPHGTGLHPSGNEVSSESRCTMANDSTCRTGSANTKHEASGVCSPVAGHIYYQRMMQGDGANH